MTYCAIAALSLLGHLNESGIESVEALTRWLVSRQVPFEKKDELGEEEREEALETGTEEEKLEISKVLSKVELGTDGRPVWGGFNGRCNKLADTCYSFWVGASLDVSAFVLICVLKFTDMNWWGTKMLKKLSLIDINANRRFLLEKTRHVIGGFSKLPEPGAIPGKLLSSQLPISPLIYHQ
jgi:geranylgeranyl transferase type-1 subunit beta